MLSYDGAAEPDRSPLIVWDKKERAGRLERRPEPPRMGPPGALRGPGGFVFDAPLEPVDIAALNVPEVADRVMRRYELSRDRVTRGQIVPQGRRRGETPDFQGRNPERRGMARRRGGAESPELDLGEDSDSADDYDTYGEVFEF